MLFLLGDLRSWLLGLVYMLPALILGFTLHEFCHAAAAVRLGDPTPRWEGRLTLNPAAHIDWVGLLLFVLLGCKWGEAAVALAGPLSNFLLAALSYALWTYVPSGWWSGFFQYGATVNLTLCFLNLLPVPPLDGFAVLRAFLPLRSYRAVNFLQRYGVLILVALSLLGVLGRVLGTLQGAALRLFAQIF